MAKTPCESCGNHFKQRGIKLHHKTCPGSLQADRLLPLTLAPVGAATVDGEGFILCASTPLL